MHTTFVIGAGAGKPNGLPTARELKEAIIANPCMHLPPREEAHAFGDRAYIEQGLARMAVDFQCSGRSSIDEFLDHPSRKPYLETGKRLIAAAIATYMVHAIASGKVTGDWHAYPFERLLLGKGLRNGTYSFVTFNYDLCLEVALQRMFRGSQGLSAEAAEAKVDGLEIVHVYGALDLMPAADAHGYPVFQSSVSAIAHAAKGIRIIAEERKETEEQARELVVKADRVVFLGFGYDPQNLTRIGIGAADWEGKKRQVFGTAHSLLTQQRKDIEKQVGPIRLGGSDQGCLEFLRDQVAM